MMTSFHSMSRINAIWSSILYKDAYTECHSKDDEILKISLLLQSVSQLFRKLRENELSYSAQLKSETLKWESEKKACQAEILQLKNDLQSSESKAHIFQGEAEVLKAKVESLQAKVSAEVEARLHAIFSNFLQQNKAATVFEMMTQMYPESEMPEKVDSPRPEKITSLKNVDASSPEMINPTPEEKKEKKYLLRNSWNGKVMPHLREKNVNIGAVAFSPNEIADTPPVKHFCKKNNRKRHENLRKLFKEEPEEAGNELPFSRKNAVIVKDTQDIDTIPVPRENIVVPETYKAEDTSDDEQNLPLDAEKENGRSLPELRAPSRTSPDPPTVTNFPTTPKKGTESRPSSPILGNLSTKKNSSRVASITPAVDSTVICLAGGLSAGIPSKMNAEDRKSLISSCLEVSYRTTESGKKRRSAQPDIKSSLKRAQAKSKLSLGGKKKITDISSFSEYNGGQRSSTDHVLDTSLLSEQQQIQLALKNSIEDGSHNSNRADDSDLTVFEPKSPLLEKDVAPLRIDSVKQQNNVKCSSVSESPCLSSETFFEPGYASTAKEDVSSQIKLSTNSAQNGKEFNGGKNGEVLDNSALNDLVGLLDDPNDTAPYPPDTSYDRLPKRSSSPDYAYQNGPVRKKTERQKLHATECAKCGEWLDIAFDSTQDKKNVLHQCSRHRSKHGQPHKSPVGYWDLGMPSTQTLMERRKLYSSDE